MYKPYVQSFICKTSVNSLILYCSFNSTPITVRLYSLMFDLNPLLSNILLSIGATYYLYLST